MEDMDISVLSVENLNSRFYNMQRKIKNMKNNWKLVLIIGAGVVAVILLCVFGIQSSQNKAFI